MMKNCTIKINTMEDACRVCALVNEFVWDVDGACGRYLIDMKSILGIMSIGFGREIDVYLHTEYVNMQEELRNDLEEWRVK